MTPKRRNKHMVRQVKHYQAENDDLSQAFQEMQEITRRNLEQYGTPMTTNEHRKFLQGKEDATV